MTPAPAKTFSCQTIIFLILILFAGVNAGSLAIYILKKYSLYKMEDLEPGMQFASFKPHLKSIARAAYLTDKPTSRKKMSESILQAQYYLAPTIFMINDLNHEYAILDSENKAFIIQTLKTLEAGRLSNNAYGQALLRRKIP